MPTLAGSELPQNRGKSRPESNPLEAIVVSDEGVKYIKARFVWVPPRIEDFCRAGAVRYLRTIWGEEALDERDILREKAMLMVSWALRREEDRDAQVYTWPANCFNSATGEWNIKALREATIRDACPNLDDLWQQYMLFRESEFPPRWTDKEWRDLVSEGKSLSLETLLSRHGFLPILQALAGLAANYAQSSPMTGSDGKP